MPSDPMPLTPEQRAELRRLERGAKWPRLEAAYGYICEPDAFYSDGSPMDTRVGEVGGDLELIVAARNALPALLDALDAAEAREARLRAFVRYVASAHVYNSRDIGSVIDESFKGDAADLLNALDAPPEPGKEPT